MKPSKPIIGVVPDYKEGSDKGYSIKNYYAIRTNYIDMINACNGAAIMLSYDYDLIDFYLENLDGVMVVGGYFDINPNRYGEDKIHPTVKLNEVRENFEYALGQKIIKTNIPFFGICNGMQLINVLHGGSVIQHIPDEKKFIDHEQSHIDGFNDYKKGYHDVIVDKNSKLFSFVKEEKFITNSSHHQAVRNVGEGLKISARCHDGVIEAIESESHPFCVGVQWHPEFEVSEFDKKIFFEFINAATKYQKEKNKINK